MTGGVNLKRRRAMLSAVADALAGALGSVVAMSVFYPVDIAKTRTQAASPVTHSNGKERKKQARRLLQSRTLATLVDLVREEGPRCAYRGVKAKTLQALAGSFVYFYAYSFVKAAIRRRTGGTLRPSLNLLAAALAGAVNIVITLPLENITTRMQTEVPVRSLQIHSEGSSHLANPHRQDERYGGDVDVRETFCCGPGDPVNDDWQSTATASSLSPVRALAANVVGPPPNCREPSLLTVTGQLYQEGSGGLARFWCGLVPSLILTCNPAINYTAFDILKSLWIARRSKRPVIHENWVPKSRMKGSGARVGAGAGERPDPIGRPTGSVEEVYLGALEAFFLAAVAKAVATLLTYPLIRAKVILMAAKSRGGSQGSSKDISSCTVPDLDSTSRGQKGQERGGLCGNTPVEMGSDADAVADQLYDMQDRTGRMVGAGSTCSEGGNGDLDGNSSHNMWDIIVAIYREEGVCGFYTGCGAQLLHTILKSALLLTTKERISTLTHAAVVGGVGRYLGNCPKQGWMGRRTFLCRQV
ncbi:unnamed protein product [Choristocarpus tenellus]